MCHRPACVVVGQGESFLMMLSEVSAPPRSPNTSALGTRMQNPDASSTGRSAFIAATLCRTSSLLSSLVRTCRLIPSDRDEAAGRRLPFSTARDSRTTCRRHCAEHDDQHAENTRSHRCSEGYTNPDAVTRMLNARKRQSPKCPNRRWKYRETAEPRLREWRTSGIEAMIVLLARVAGRRVTESGSRAFLRYIKTVPCVAVAARYNTVRRGPERRRERDERR